MLAALDRYHGQPNGIFSCDEHYAGLDPSQGTELCTVVEAMFSLETDISILGDAALGDRLERISYNALPATFSPDMWAHQYDQQANQVMCSLANHHWATNGPESNIFGLEPNFGCCTANMHQGWPKFAAHLWMATPDGGLAAIAYGPSEVSTTVRGDTPVTIEEQTDYPFRDSLTFAIKLAKPAAFPLVLRIPAWAEGATVSVNGQAQSGVTAGGFYRVDRKWSNGDRVAVRFPMRVRTSSWYNNSVAVERGPLVYSLKIGESWHKIKQTGPSADWEVYPTTPWNYALALDSFTVKENPVAKQPFDPATPAIEITAKARRAARMATGRRFRRPASGEPGDRRPVRRNHHADPVRRKQAADNRLPLLFGKAVTGSNFRKKLPLEARDHPLRKLRACHRFSSRDDSIQESPLSTPVAFVSNYLLRNIKFGAGVTVPHFFWNAPSGQPV